MTATTLATTFGGIAGTDLEAELAQARRRDHDRDEASAAERDDAFHDARRAGSNDAAREAAAAGHASAPLLRTDRADARPQPGDAAVELRGVGKRYGERAVLSEFDLSIERGSFVAIVGRSGCGKSTLLRLVAGLESAEAGSLAKTGVAGAALETRIMFQDSRLLPWKTVLQNVTLGLGRGARDHARSVLDEVGLLERANDWPAQLSGGQRQRVALARALVHRPQLLLLDEPLGALDALTRIEMHTLIERLWREHGFTALLVTHDVQEAVALADRILLIEDGRIALDQSVPLARPRARASAAFAALEDDVLQRVLASAPRAHASAPHETSERERFVSPSDVRWAV
ncbi:MAG TPA: ATP-binding cassette domain-containing protein [Trinickia sp.]|nr:ATP-binding cassette domain-containing protein [Trinickia sp.]